MLTQREPELTFNDAHNAPHSSSNYYRSLPPSLALFSRPPKTPEKWALIFSSIKTQYKSNRTNTQIKARACNCGRRCAATRAGTSSVPFSLSERHLISFFLTEHVSLSSALIGFQFHQDSTQLGHRLPACLPGLFEAIVHRCADRVLHQTLKQCQLTYFFDVLFQKNSANWQCPAMHVWWSVVRLNATEAWSNGRTNLFELDSASWLMVFMKPDVIKIVLSWRYAGQKYEFMAVT